MTAISSFSHAPIQHTAGSARTEQRGSIAARLWLALRRVGQRRAAAQLLELARQHAQTSPACARDLRAAATACLHGHDTTHHP